MTIAETAAERSRQFFSEDEAEILRKEYITLYRRLVGSEINLCNVNATTRVCHIGCGPMPLTMMMWHKYTGCFITGIDIDANAVATARQVIEARSLQDAGAYSLDKIKLAVCDGKMFDYAGYDIVLLSSTVQPKAAVCDRIMATAAPDTMVIERVPFGVWRHFRFDLGDISGDYLDLKEKVRTAYLELRRYTPRSGGHSHRFDVAAA